MANRLIHDGVKLPSLTNPRYPIQKRSLISSNNATHPTHTKDIIFQPKNRQSQLEPLKHQFTLDKMTRHSTIIMPRKQSQKSQGSTNISSSCLTEINNHSGPSSPKHGQLRPLTTERCRHFGTTRISFNRRESHKNKQIVIINIEGVLVKVKVDQQSTSINFGYPLALNKDPDHILIMRHNACVGLSEL